MDGNKYEDKYFKTFCIPFIKLLLRYLGIEFETVRLMPTNLIINASISMDLDFLVCIDEKYLINIEFMSTKLTRKIKSRMCKYAIFSKERYNYVDIETIVISTYEMHSYYDKYRISEKSGLTIRIVSFTDLSVKKTLNDIRQKIENKEELTEEGMFYFTLVPFMYNEKGIIDSLCKAVEFSEMIEIKDKRLWRSVISMHTALVCKFVKDEKLKNKLTDVLQMRDNFLFEKFGRKQYEEGIREGEEEGIKKGKNDEKEGIAKNMLKKKFNIKDIAEITGLSKSKVRSLKTTI